MQKKKYGIAPLLSFNTRNIEILIQKNREINSIYENPYHFRQFCALASKEVVQVDHENICDILPPETESESAQSYQLMGGSIKTNFHANDACF